jgi:RNA polymerase sigma-70 factor (ECF subfamily)
VTGGEDERLDALRGRQPEACERFVDDHYQAVYRFFLWLANAKELAEDLTQETFAAFWASLDRPDRPRIPDLKAWLYGIARNRWRKWARDAAPTSVELEEALEIPDSAPGPEACAVAALAAESVARAVAALPADYREALVLRVFQEMSYRQIGAALSIREELARWRVHRARQALRAALAPETEKEKSGEPSPR